MQETRTLILPSAAQCVEICEEFEEERETKQIAGKGKGVEIHEEFTSIIVPLVSWQQKQHEAGVSSSCYRCSGCHAMPVKTHGKACGCTYFYRLHVATAAAAANTTAAAAAAAAAACRLGQSCFGCAGLRLLLPSGDMRGLHSTISQTWLHGHKSVPGCLAGPHSTDKALPGLAAVNPLTGKVHD